MKKVFETLAFIFMQTFKILFNGLKPNDGLMGYFEKNRLFRESNKGLLLDGQKQRLSLKDSFNHLALISRTGGGKTTTFVIPNILKLAGENNSMVITDISGELYTKTSGYLAKNGYKIYILNPENLSESIFYNPMHYATDSTKIDELVNILIKSSKQGLGNDSGEFWESGAKSLISILIKVLIATKDDKYINLANVRYLINNYGADGENLFSLVEKFSNPKTINEFRGFVKGNPQTVLSMVSTANVALSAIGINDNLEKLTSSHSMDFENFRKEKSVVYIKIPEQKQEQYRFLLNIFYHQFFSTMMEVLPRKKDLPVFCLLDEFGNMNLPNFETTITTVRKYNISISIILQNIKQLENKYGKASAETILNGGIASKLFFSGADLDTTEMLSRVLGDVDNIAVMSSAEIRMMKDTQALFIMTNKLPLKLNIKPYYNDYRFTKHTKEKPYEIKSSAKNISLEYINLEYEK